MELVQYFNNIQIKTKESNSVYQVTLERYSQAFDEPPIEMEVTLSNRQYIDSIGDYDLSLDITSLLKIMLEVDFCFENFETNEFVLNGFNNSDTNQQVSITPLSPDTFIEFVNRLSHSGMKNSINMEINSIAHLTWVIHDIIHADRDFVNGSFQAPREYYAICVSWAIYYAKCIPWSTSDEEELKDIVEEFNNRLSDEHGRRGWAQGMEGFNIETLIQNIGEYIETLYEEGLVTADNKEYALFQLNKNYEVEEVFEEDLELEH